MDVVQHSVRMLLWRLHYPYLDVAYLDVAYLDVAYLDVAYLDVDNTNQLHPVGCILLVASCHSVSCILC